MTTSLRTANRLAPVIVGLNLAISRGEIVGLVGESGSGKSMTARTIVRALPRGASIDGEVLVDGEDIASAGKARVRELRSSKLAMIFQDPRAAIDPLWKVGDYLTEGMRVHDGLGREQARARALELLADVGIDDGERRLRQYPGELSGGLLQRVMIAGALAGDPDFLIADEATTALDVTTQAEIAKIFVRLRRERGLAMLFITHDLALAAALCDRICVMYAGRIVEVQDAQGVFDGPAHPYSKALLEARPDVRTRRPALAVIPGRPTSALRAPSGCPFHPRCPFAIDECRVAEPRLELVDGAETACIRARELTSEGMLGQGAAA